jgi:hypothetical protein
MPRIDRPTLAFAAFLATTAMISTAEASAITEMLKGQWTGSGTLKLANGKSERIRCHGNASGAEKSLNQFFNCASTANTFSFSTSLSFSGSRVSGNWRGPEGGGTASGSASSSSMSLRLVSSSGRGRLNATFSSCRLSLTVTGWSTELRSLSVRLRKPC